MIKVKKIKKTRLSRRSDAYFKKAAKAIGKKAFQAIANEVEKKLASKNRPAKKQAKKK